MKKVILLYLGFFLTTFLIAQTHTWQRTNPGGGGAFSTVGASASGIIIAGSDLSGAYRSADGGQTWDVIGASKGLTETHVSGVGFHRSDGNTLYIGTENGIFRSNDGGNSVKQVLVGGYITDIEFGTNNGNIGYASYHPTYNSNNGVIYRSVNNGQTWSQRSTNLPAGIRILKIVLNPNNTQEVYILTGEGRFACGPADVFKSSDGGLNWTNLTANLPSILDLTINPNNPQSVFITTMNAACDEQFYWTDMNGNLYNSTDGGANWGNPIYNQSGVIWLDVNSANNIRLIDPREPYPWISSSGTWTSNDAGNSFTQTGDVENWDIFFNNNIFHSYGSSFNGISKTLGEDLSNPNNYFWVNYQRIFKTTDNGTIFKNVFTDEISNGQWRSRGFDNITMMDLSISEANPNIVYAAYFDVGIWRSMDQGTSWENCNDETFSGNWSGNGGNCATILADPDRSNVVWASQSGNQRGQSPTYLLKSSDTGDKNSWTLSNAGLPDQEIMGLSIDTQSPSNNRTLYVTALGDVYKSINDGANWSMVFDCNGCRFTAIDYHDSNLIYAGGENGLWRSTDAGINWTDQSHAQMKGTPGINFWNRQYDAVFDIVTDPNNADWVYAIALGNDKGLFKSTDRGNSWAKLLTDDFMRNVAIVPTNSNVLYATSSSAFKAGGYKPNSNGVWFSSDGGQNWIQQNLGMAYPFAQTVKISNEVAPIVFVGSPGTGFQKSAVPNFALSSSINNVLESMDLQVYPNPFSDLITLEGNLSVYNIELIDVRGNVLGIYERLNFPANIDLSTLEKGIYFVLVHSEESPPIVQKIVKQ